ncbi:MAG: alpha/beta hydrolase [Cyanobacteria bacterium]|nr:alpha/beta hydrolase [Cyanobacteriota bacterium]MDW8199729.1 alpha/beta hydrolase [Cyanobacteriota bacterium SKYGB_h_bin112]
MTSINVLGVPCAYELTDPVPQSPTLVFVHGWLLSREYWQPLVQRLSPTYQCLSYDLRGFGQSQLYPRSDIASDIFTKSSNHLATKQSEHGVPNDAQALQMTTADVNAVINRLGTQDYSDPSPLTQQWRLSDRHQGDRLSDQSFHASYTPAAYAKDLAVLLQLLNLANVWLIGHSLGGIIALWAANQLPDVVQGVICLNSGGGIYFQKDFEKFRAAGQQILKLRPRWLCHVPLIDLMFARSTVVQPIDRTWRRQRLVDFVMAHPEAALGALLDSTTEAEVNRLPLLVSALKQPVYFLAGAQDPVMQPSYVQHLASFHPLFGTCGDNVIEIEDCGHMAMIEQPDRVTTEITSILAKHTQREALALSISHRSMT